MVSTLSGHERPFKGKGARAWPSFPGGLQGRGRGPVGGGIPGEGSWISGAVLVVPVVAVLMGGSDADR